MNSRIYKKLCKKAAQAMRFNNCDKEDGIYYVIWSCGGYDSEWDSEDAWPYLVETFNSEVNTMVDHDSECGISWKPDHLFTKATAINVLKWAKDAFAL